MKKIYILLLGLLLLTGCENEKEELKNRYIAMKNNTLNEANYVEQTLPVDIVTTVERTNEEEVVYKIVISNPTENMHDIKVMVVHNYYIEGIYPSVGLFDNTKELSAGDKETTIILEDTIKTTKNISKLDLEIKVLIEYINDYGETKEVYYKTT